MSWGQGRSPRLRQHATRALPRHCQHCGTTNQLELDHIMPRAEGGTDHITHRDGSPRRAGRVAWHIGTRHTWNGTQTVTM